MADSKFVTREMYVPDSYVFQGANPAYALVVHKTASPGMSTASAVAAYFQNGSDGRHVSSHYIVGKDGEVVQCVRERDGAGANAALPVEPGRNTLFSQAINWNLRTISVEHVDDSPNNSQPLTPAQKKASFNLIKDICTRKGIAASHVVQHRDLQPRSKPLCAGNYPMDELRLYIENKVHPMTGPKKNKNGEIADVVTISQFWPGKTEFACGFYTAAMVRYANPPGAGVHGNNHDVESWAETEYIREYGSDGANKTGGVSIDDMHRLLVAALPNSGNSHYMDLPISVNSAQASDLAHIKGALNSGYPVAMTVSEASIYDKELGKNPYWWGASGNHVFLVTGIDPEGDFLVHDEANVTGSLQGPNYPRPQPRHYKADRIQTSWASMCRMPWLVPFPNGWDAATGTPLNQDGSTPTPTPTPTPGGTLELEALKNGDDNDKNALISYIWGSTFPRDTAIFNDWRTKLLSGTYYGVPLEPEQNRLDELGEDSQVQRFTAATAIWNKKTHVLRWV